MTFLKQNKTKKKTKRSLRMKLATASKKKNVLVRTLEVNTAFGFELRFFFCEFGSGKVYHRFSWLFSSFLGCN